MSTQGGSIRLSRGATIGALDQVVSGLTNTVVLLVVSRTLELAEFGALAIALVVYTVSNMLLYSFVTDRSVALIVAGTEWRSIDFAFSTCLYGGLLTATTGGLLIVLAHGVMLEAVGTVLILLGGLALHEVIRQLVVAAGRSDIALRADVIWLATSLGLAFGSDALAINQSASTALAVWGAGAWVGSAAILLSFRLRFTSVRRTFTLITEDLAKRMVLSVDLIVESAAAQLTILGIGATLGLEAIGALRTVALGFGLVGVSVSAVRLIGQPWFLRSRGNRNRLTSGVLAMSAAIGGLVVLNAVAWAFLPSSIAERVLGERWETLDDLLTIGAFYMFARSVPAAPFFAIRVLGSARGLVSARTVSLALQSGSVVVAVTAGLDDSTHLLAVLSIGYLLGAIVWFIVFRQSIGQPLERAKVA